MDADPQLIYTLLMDRSTLQPLTQRSIGKATFVYDNPDNDDRTFIWTYQFCGVKLSVTVTIEIANPGQELGMRLSGDFSGFLHWHLSPFGPSTLATLTVDYQLPDGIIGMLSQGFVERQVAFELMLLLKNLQSVVSQQQYLSQPASRNTLVVRR